MSSAGTTSFPRRSARTQRFTLGEPRAVTVSADGRRVAFLRSAAGDDPVQALWVLDVETGEERLVAEPRALLTTGLDALPAAERARRERQRESAGGITGYATDAAGTVAAFALGGQLGLAGLVSATSRIVDVGGPVVDPRPDPLARRVAYVSGASLRVAELDGTSRQLAGPSADERHVTWGSAEFIAAEEMGRLRGFWWAPSGERLAAARVDDSMVERWWISDPAHPDVEPTSIAYARAGTRNAEVTVHVVDLDGSTHELAWDRRRLEYVVDVGWRDDDHVTLVLESRDQRVICWQEHELSTGQVRTVAEDGDERFVDIVDGGWGWRDDVLVRTAIRDGGRRLLVGDEVVSPPELEVRSVVAVGAAVVVTANTIDEPAELHVWRWEPEAFTCLTSEPGVHGAAVGGRRVVLRSATLARPGITTSVVDGPTIASKALDPGLTPAPRLLRLGERRLPAALFLPSAAGDDPLPVLLDPYGGPHHARVVASASAHLTSQWFADQGFAVLVIDNRGTPGLGSEWERAVHHDLATCALDDQIDGLHAAAELEPRLDLTRVGIRGWSFGGYLAALAVLRRPDAVHAAVAGAPVTDWRLYDTHYTERYLGQPGPDGEDGPYESSSLLTLAPRLRRPLLLVHGLADDNVVAAHTLQLSAALTRAGRAHSMLPLPGVTHVASQEDVAENLMLLQVEFLRDALSRVEP